jgi:hypothetical protein
MFATIQLTTSVFSSAVENVKITTCKSKILPVVLYGRESWSLTLREQHTCRLTVFEGKVLRRIFEQISWSNRRLETTA